MPDAHAERAERIEDPRLRRAFYAMEDAVDVIEGAHNLTEAETAGLLAEVLTLKFGTLVARAVLGPGMAQDDAQAAVRLASNEIVGAVDRITVSMMRARNAAAAR